MHTSVRAHRSDRAVLEGTAEPQGTAETPVVVPRAAHSPSRTRPASPQNSTSASTNGGMKAAGRPWPQPRKRTCFALGSASA